MSDTERSGTWLGSVEGIRVRDPGPDADGPVVEVIGEHGLAAMEFDDEAFVDGLTHAAAEIQAVFDEVSDS